MAARPGFHFVEQGGQKISRREFNQLARAFGLPAKPFWQITKGESNHLKYVQQHDPGDGMVGYGLFQLTPNAWGKGTPAMRQFERLGGVQGMKDVRNQFAMARFLYKSAGNSFKPWYGTRYLTDRSGEGTLGPVNRRMLQQVGGGGGDRVTATRLKFDPNVGASAEVADALSRRPRPTVTNPSAPGFAASATLPTGYQGVASGEAPRQKTSLTDQLAQLDQGGVIDAGRIGGSKIKGGGGGGGGGGGQPSGSAQIHELFWNGPGAQNIDNGKRVGKGFVSGHTDHVHFAADRASMKRANRLAKAMGLTVLEYGKGITSGHASGSYHYQPFGAMDVSGDVNAMKKFARKVSRL